MTDRLVTPDEIVETVARVTGVNASDLLTSRAKDAHDARALVALLIRLARPEISVTEIAERLQHSHQAVCHGMTFAARAVAIARQLDDAAGTLKLTPLARERLDAVAKTGRI